MTTINKISDDALEIHNDIVEVVKKEDLLARKKHIEDLLKEFDK